MFISTRRILALSCALALGLSALPANAQNVDTITSTVTVLNAITVAEVDPLNFGTVGLVAAAGESPTLTLDPTANTVTAGGTGTIVGLTGHNRADVSIDAPDGAATLTINMEIDNPVDLTDGVSVGVFPLSAFTYDDQAGNTGAVALATAVPVTLNATGDANVLIGATITADGNNAYADGIYSGSFDVTVYY